MNLILLDSDDFAGSEVVTLTDARATHLLEVIKVTAGQTVRVGRLDGPFGRGIVQSARDGQVTMRCEFEADAPCRPNVDVLLALPRPKVMRRLWAQLAAIGVGQIILTNAGRVERHSRPLRSDVPPAPHRRIAAGSRYAPAVRIDPPSVQDPDRGSTGRAVLRRPAGRGRSKRHDVARHSDR